MHATASVDAFGERIAGSSGQRWAVAYGDYVTLWDGTEAAGNLRLSEPALDLCFVGETLLAAPSRPDETLPLLSRSLEGRRAVAAAWDGDRLVVAEAAARGGQRQLVRLYAADREPGPVLWEDDSPRRIEAVAAGDGRLAAAADELRVWDARTLAPVLGVPARDGSVRRIVLAAGAVVCGYAGGWVAVDDGLGWPAHADGQCVPAVHPDGRRLATAGWDGRVALWTLAGEPIAEAPVGAPVQDIAFLGTGHVLALHRLPATGVTVLALDG